MKNKKIIWLLLPGVLIIWGLIFFQIRKAVSNSGQLVAVSDSEDPIVPENRDTSIHKLKLDYEDPFLKNIKAVRPKPTSTNRTIPQRPKVVKTVNRIPLRWPTISYKGLINNKKNKPLYLVEVDDASVFMTEGEFHNDLRLLKAYRDSIRIEYQGEEKRTFIKQ